MYSKSGESGWTVDSGQFSGESALESKRVLLVEWVESRRVFSVEGED